MRNFVGQVGGIKVLFTNLAAFGWPDYLQILYVLLLLHYHVLVGIESKSNLNKKGKIYAVIFYICMFYKTCLNMRT